MSNPPVVPATTRAGAVKVTTVVGFLIVMELVSGIVQGMIPVLLPKVGVELHVSAGDLNWVSSLQLLSAALSVPLFGRLGDLYGHRRLLRVAVLSLAAGSVLVAWSPQYSVLLLGRILQGPLAALLPLEIGIVRDKLDGDGAKRAIGMLVGALTFGASVGLIASGLLAEVITGVHGILWVPALATLACAVVVFTLVPESTTRAQARIDWAGAGLLSAGLGALLLAIAQGPGWGWGSGGVIALFGVAALTLAAWGLVELRAEDPIVDLRLSVRRNLLPVYLASFVLGAALFGSQTASTMFMAMPREKVGFGFGLNTLGVGWTSLPSGICAFLAATVVARLGRGVGQRATLALGGTLLAVGYLALAFAHDEPWQFVASRVLTGFGTGLALGALPALVLDATPADSTGIATSIYNTTKTLGGSVAGAVFAAVLNALTFAHTAIPTEHAYIVVWACCAGISLLIVLAAAVLPRHRAHDDPAGRPAVPALAD
ncbi:MFS transporter [Streptomyces sp. NPDC004069]